MLSDNEFRRLLDRLDRPWSGYRKVRKGVMKRLRRHMTDLACPSIQAYLDRIVQDSEARARCEALLTVTISRFFRDRQLWDYLRSSILPTLTTGFGGDLKAWSAGCASGEEPYSLAMVAQTVTEKFPAAAGLSILATDADSACLQRAQEGRYPESSLREVPENFRERWFTRAPGRRARRIDSLLGGPICWQVHELLNEPPQGVFQLILLRNNLLTYYQGLRSKNAFDRILGRLAPGGALIVGSHERPPPDTRPLVRDPQCPWVYWG